MLFVLQKIIWYIIVPPASLLLLIAAGPALRKRHRKAGDILVWSGLALFYVLSLSFVSDAILRPLEHAYPVLVDTNIQADAIVVPGAGTVDREWVRAAPDMSAETGMRLMKGVELARDLRVPLVLCGGNGEPFATNLRDADAMEAAALKWGIPARQLLVERESRNTLENSHAVRKLVNGNRIVLATSAYYMRRAVAMFEHRGFTVIPAPVYFLTQSRNMNISAFVPGAGNLNRSAIGIAEWISMAWWKLRGEI
ncbi:MAG TPA: YdcF family protein [Nitrospirota bacterium]|nr:YdcF family protein [Nitrospirota bacterium]